MITDQQVDILNTLNKYLPAMRLWYHVGASGLGDIIKSQQTSIDAIPGGTDPIDLVPGQPVTTFSTVPANAKVQRVKLTITTPYSVGALVAIGDGTNTYMTGAENDAQSAGTYFAEILNTTVVASTQLVATVSGSPAAGAATVWVDYAIN